MSLTSWGNSPMTVGLIRGIVVAILVGALAALKAYYNDGVVLDQAIGQGLIPAVISLLALLGYGAADQARVGAGKVNAGDVPVAIEANIKNVSPATIAHTMNIKTAAHLRTMR